MARFKLVTAGVLGIAGVMVGAYGAHGLEQFLERANLEPELVAKRLDQCEVAVRYHLLHALALTALGLSTFGSQRCVNWAAAFWLLGILLFSGGLYSIVFLGAMGHWAIVPAGGVCFMLGWAWIVVLGLTGSGDQP